jgi:hypothetical protein
MFVTKIVVRTSLPASHSTVNIFMAILALRASDVSLCCHLAEDHALGTSKLAVATRRVGPLAVKLLFA